MHAFILPVVSQFIRRGLSPSGGTLFISLATHRTREVYWQFKWSPGNLSVVCLVKRFSSVRRQGVYWQSKWWRLTHVIGLKKFCSHPFYSDPFCHMCHCASRVCIDIPFTGRESVVTHPVERFVVVFRSQSSR